MRHFPDDIDPVDSMTLRAGLPLPLDSAADHGAHGFPGPPEPQNGVRIGDLVRRYWLLGLLLTVLGASAGFASIVYSSPVYKARLILEVKNDDGPLKTALGLSSADTTELNIQTMIQILHGTSFLRRGADRLQSENIPLAPITNDIFSRIRQRVRPSSKDPLETAAKGLTTAVATFDARPITRTRLIELSCDSTSPEVASQFLNAMASEFIEDSVRNRMQSSQKTSEWLLAQIEDTKSKLQEAEDRLQDFVRSSGNLFAGQGQEITLDDSKLSQLRVDLAKIQTERIAKQIRYELTLKNTPESLPNVLDDQNLRGYQQQINNLRQEKAALETTLTSNHNKVRRVDSQLEVLESTLRNEIGNVVKRIRNEYEAAANQEKMLSSAYVGQSRRVSGEAGKAAQFNALKREVEMLRQMYQSLLLQSNQSGLSVSVPTTPIRVVEPSLPPQEPYKPRPVLNISFGMIAGLALTAGFSFIREKSDKRVKSPESIRRLLNIHELGVIPNSSARAVQPSKRFLARFRGRTLPSLTLGQQPPPNQNGTAATAAMGAFALAESFRETLASILRSQRHKRKNQVILVTSPGPGEGKTTVVSNLGIVLAETGRRVLLMDGDFRCPELHNRFGLPNEWGLRDLLAENTPISEYAPEKLGTRTEVPGLFVLTNRGIKMNVSRSLYSKRFQSLIETLQQQYDMILVDAPPVLYLADARVMATMTDGVILVLRSGLTNEASALEAHRRIREDGLTLLGTVLNDFTPRKSELHQRYYYGYAESESRRDQ